jgi:hypothetical protein
MATRNPTLAQPPRSRSEAPGSIYIAIPARRPVTHYLRKRLYGVLTALAVGSLLSPLLAAALTFAGASV